MSYRLQVLVYHCIFINASRNFIQLYNIFSLRIIYVNKKALCQMLGFSPYESSLAPIIVMVGAILFAQK